MKVFIENEAHSNQKNIYNEKTLKKRKTVTISREYPYPYGFIIGTTGEDGDNIDCFVITENHLHSGQIVECDIVGIMEQIEKSRDDRSLEKDEMDHNILATLDDDPIVTITPEIQNTLSEFVLHAFDHIRINKVKVGRFLDQWTAEQYISAHADTPYKN